MIKKRGRRATDWWSRAELCYMQALTLLPYTFYSIVWLAFVVASAEESFGFAWPKTRKRKASNALILRRCYFVFFSLSPYFLVVESNVVLLCNVLPVVGDRIDMVGIIKQMHFSIFCRFLFFQTIQKRKSQKIVEISESALDFLNFARTMRKGLTHSRWKS